MSNVCTPGTSGQNPAPSAPHNPAPLAELLDTVRQLGDRVDGLGQRFERLHRRALNAIAERSKKASAEPLARHASRPIPALALRSDGRVLLSTASLAGADISERERWEGVVLHGTEAWDMLGHVSEGCDGAASRVAARIRWPGESKD